MRSHRDKKPDEKRKALEPYGPPKGSAGRAVRDPIELFRKAHPPGASGKPQERGHRIKFEVLDESPEDCNKRDGFNPYDSRAPRRRR